MTYYVNPCSGHEAEFETYDEALAYAENIYKHYHYQKPENMIHHRWVSLEEMYKALDHLDEAEYKYPDKLDEVFIHNLEPYEGFNDID